MKTVPVPFLDLECPNLKLKKPPWVYALVVVSYLFITRGIIYYVIVEPPSVGSMTDEHWHQRPIAFSAFGVKWAIYYGRTHMQLPGLGFIILDPSNAPNIPKLGRFLLFIGFIPVLLFVFFYWLEYS